MKVQIDFVDQRNAGRFYMRLSAQMWIELGASYGDIGDCRCHGPLAIAQRPKRKPVTISKFDDDIVFLEIENNRTRAFDAFCDRLVHGVESFQSFAVLRLYQS